MARIAARKLGVNKVAFTLGRTIYLHNTSRECFLRDRKWVQHELQHVAQFQRYGFLRFVGLYLLESLRHGYYQNTFEQEARYAEINGQWNREHGRFRTAGGEWNLMIIVPDNCS